MAIFNFVKQAGQVMTEGLEMAANATASVANDAAEAISIASIQAKITASSVNPRDLALKKIDDETVKVYAVVDTQDDKEELILIVGNTPGVAKIEDAIKVKPEGKEEVINVKPRFYTVKEGDTLSSIAESELGDSTLYMAIFDANRNLLSNPDSIDVGQTLRIPRT
jgi:nucleoid-associated protein YgaU